MHCVFFFFNIYIYNRSPSLVSRLLDWTIYQFFTKLFSFFFFSFFPRRSRLRTTLRESAAAAAAKSAAVATEAAAAVPVSICSNSCGDSTSAFPETEEFNAGFVSTNALLSALTFRCVHMESTDDFVKSFNTKADRYLVLKPVCRRHFVV